MTMYDVVLHGGGPWGFRISGGRDVNQPISISRVTPGSKASSHDIASGDVITAIDGCSTSDMTHLDAQNMVKSAGMAGTLRLTLHRDHHAAGYGPTQQHGGPTVAHLQYNTPVNLYSTGNIVEAFKGQTRGLNTEVQLLDNMGNQDAQYANSYGPPATNKLDDISLSPTYQALKAEERGESYSGPSPGWGGTGGGNYTPSARTVGYNQSAGFGQPNAYSNQPSGYGNQTSGYGGQVSSQPSGYSNQPSGYSSQPSGYSSQPTGYSSQPSGYSSQPSGYSSQPSGYSSQPGGYNQPSGYGGYNKPATGPTGYNRPGTFQSERSSFTTQPKPMGGQTSVRMQSTPYNNPSLQTGGSGYNSPAVQSRSFQMIQQMVEDDYPVASSPRSPASPPSSLSSYPVKPAQNRQAQVSNPPSHEGSNHAYQPPGGYQAKPQFTTPATPWAPSEKPTRPAIIPTRPMAPSMKSSLPNQKITRPMTGNTSVIRPPAPSSGAVPTCTSCKDMIRGPFVTAVGKNWHPEHFKCSVCSVSLQDIGFVEDNNRLLCEKDYNESFAPVCAKCGQRVVGDVLHAIDKTWHAHCFVCSHCQQPFGNSGFHLEDGDPYCEKDWNELFTSKCHACHRPIEAGHRWLEALDLNWHADCFKCTTCHKKLEGESFFSRNGQAYCRMHSRSG